MYIGLFWKGQKKVGPLFAPCPELMGSVRPLCPRFLHPCSFNKIFAIKVCTLLKKNFVKTPILWISILRRWAILWVVKLSYAYYRSILCIMQVQKFKIGKKSLKSRALRKYVRNSWFPVNFTLKLVLVLVSISLTMSRRQSRDQPWEKFHNLVDYTIYM